MTPSPIPDQPAVLPPSAPRRGNALTRGLGRLLLRVMGWRVVGNPPDVPRFLVTAAPHTSNMDGFIFLLAMFAVGLDLHWIAKHSLFRSPWGGLLRWMGGIGIDRTAATDVVRQVAGEFRRRPGMVLVIAPEGTRGKAGAWKSGFHRMALMAGVPICMGFMDYRLRRVGFGPSFTPTAEYQADLLHLSRFYAAVTPRHPQRFVLPVPPQT